MQAKQKGWCITNVGHPVNGQARVWPEYFRRTRREAIADFCKGSGGTWKQWHDDFNYRCVRATSTVVEVEETEKVFYVDGIKVTVMKGYDKETGGYTIVISAKINGEKGVETRMWGGTGALRDSYFDFFSKIDAEIFLTTETLCMRLDRIRKTNANAAP